VIWLVIGLVIYFSYSRHHSHLARDRSKRVGYLSNETHGR
jgi:hypothetical protein